MAQFQFVRADMDWWRRCFQTREGGLGLGPEWAKEGDVVMLIKGGYVPYIFTHVDEDLRRRAMRLREMLRKEGPGKGNEREELLNG